MSNPQTDTVKTHKWTADNGKMEVTLVETNGVFGGPAITYASSGGDCDTYILLKYPEDLRLLANQGTAT